MKEDHIRRLDPRVFTSSDEKRTPRGDAEGSRAERRRGLHLHFRDPRYGPPSYPPSHLILLADRNFRFPRAQILLTRRLYI